jgi:DNA-binding transcriptional MerR regulator
MEGMMNPDDTYTIQEVSRETDLPSSTLRYYEDIGLLDAVDRAENGHRRYTLADVHRIILIKRLRLTGMTIRQIRDFVALYAGGKRTAAQRRVVLEAHRVSVQAQVAELIEMLGFIDYKIGLYKEEEADCEREREHEIPAVG